ncbi:MAG TPA: PaaI family thioesterase [Polyangiales bacterium]|nr:PaaI family thioesterase [Polyangiales bacterium]
MPRMNAEELIRFIEENFPGGRAYCQVEEVGEDSLRVRLPYSDDYLRPGGTISGPALMSLADTGAYLLILSMIGPVALAVTTSLNINFMRRPTPDDMIAKAKMLKLGRQLAVVDIHIEAASTGVLVAQATVTYSIPPKGEAQK